MIDQIYEQCQCPYRKIGDCPCPRYPRNKKFKTQSCEDCPDWRKPQPFQITHKHFDQVTPDYWAFFKTENNITILPIIYSQFIKYKEQGIPERNWYKTKKRETVQGELTNFLYPIKPLE